MDQRAIPAESSVVVTIAGRHRFILHRHIMAALHGLEAVALILVGAAAYRRVRSH